MSSDRELLEAAAKAAGYDWRDKTINANQDGSPVSDWPYDWNPLTDSGDALELAVKLRIHITMNAFGAAASGPNGGAVEQGRDVLAATRRAIVRAASLGGTHG